MPSPATQPPTPRRQRWLRIRLRTLMGLVIPIGVVLGWMNWRINQARTQREAVAIVRSAGGLVQYDDKFHPDDRRQVASRWLGDDFFRQVVAVTTRRQLPPGGLRLIGGLDGLKQLTLADTTGLELEWPALGGLERLARVTLRGPAVNDAALTVLGQQRSLRYLQLTRTQATDRGLSRLVGAARLETLIIASAPRLTDAGLARALADGWPSLRDLRIGRVGESLPQTVAALARHHPHLRQLWLVGWPIQAADLAPLGDLAELTWLYLAHADVDDAALVQVARLPNLRHLALNDTDVTDEGMRTVAQLTGLVSLDLSETRVGPLGLLHLRDLPDLAYLNITGTRITRADLDSFAEGRSDQAARTQIIGP